MREAVETRGQFNIIHPVSGLKIDIFVNKDNGALSAAAPRPGHDAWFARPEDVILSKLVYYREGQSALHLRDIVGILRVSGDDLDRPYVTEWVERLGLRALWGGRAQASRA